MKWLLLQRKWKSAGMTIPLLIGGATTSKIHTAVKIEEHYQRGQTVYVLDASRSVTVASKLLSDDKSSFIEETKNEYARMRDHHKIVEQKRNAHLV